MSTATLRKIAVLAAVAAVGSGCSSLGRQYFDNRIEVTADFDNAAGLYPGNDVDMLGLPIGSVVSVDPKGSDVEVTLSIDTDVRVPADAIAAIVSPQLITNRHVELTPTYPGHGPVLADGDVIPLSRTRTPVELDRILKTFDQLGAALQGNNISGPLASRVLFPMLDGNGDKLRQTLDALSAAFRVTEANRDQISDTIVKLNDITSIIADNDQTVRDFSGQLTDLMSLLAQQAPGLRAVLDQLDDFVANTSAVVAQNKPQLLDALRKLVLVTALMRSNARNLTELTDVTPLLFQNMNNAIDYPDQSLRLHGLLDKSVLDGELLAKFCQNLLMRSDGCRAGRIGDLGPDLGLSAALLGLTTPGGTR